MSDVKFPNLPESEYVSYTSGQLVDALCKAAQPGSHRHEEIKGALQAVLTKDLVNAIDKHERAATRLSNILFWLNIVLGVFTIAGTVIAVCQAVGK